LNQKVTPDSLKSKIVIDINGIKAGIIKRVLREKYRRLTADFIEIEIDKIVPWGFKNTVKIHTRDASLQEDGTIKVKFTKEQLKTMSKEQELQKHPPTI